MTKTIKKSLNRALFLSLFPLLFFPVQCEKQNREIAKEHSEDRPDRSVVQGLYKIHPSRIPLFVQLKPDGTAVVRNDEHIQSSKNLRGVFTLQDGLLRIYVKSVDRGPVGVFAYEKDGNGAIRLEKKGIWDENVKELILIARPQ